MASYVFIEKQAGVEIRRLCATDSSSLRLSSGVAKTPATVVVGDLLRSHGYILRVDQIVTS